MFWVEVVVLRFHFRKVSRASVGKMVCEGRQLDAMFGCVGGALHNSMGGLGTWKEPTSSDGRESC